MLIKQGKYKEAEKIYSKAVAIDPLNIYFYQRWAYALSEQDKYKEAEDIYRRAVAIVPQNIDLYKSQILS